MMNQILELLMPCTRKQAEVEADVEQSLKAAEEALRRHDELTAEAIEAAKVARKALGTAAVLLQLSYLEKMLKEKGPKPQ